MGTLNKNRSFTAHPSGSNGSYQGYIVRSVSTGKRTQQLVIGAMEVGSGGASVLGGHLELAEDLACPGHGGPVKIQYVQCPSQW
jgi:hypothetical protein